MIYLGLDLGKLRDFTALAAVEELGPTPWGGGEGELAVRYLERAALGTPYIRIVERVAAVSRELVLRDRCHLVVDGTGVGDPVEELLRAANGGWRGITAVAITGGDQARQASGYGVGERWNVPRRTLLSGLQVLLEKGKLKIASKMPESRALVRELIRMRSGTGGKGEPDDSGHADHDDLVMAVALACWQAGRSKVGPGGYRVI